MQRASHARLRWLIASALAALAIAGVIRALADSAHLPERVWVGWQPRGEFGGCIDVTRLATSPGGPLERGFEPGTGALVGGGRSEFWSIHRPPSNWAYVLHRLASSTPQPKVYKLYPAGERTFVRGEWWLPMRCVAHASD